MAVPLPIRTFEEIMVAAYREHLMKITEHSKPPFDPDIRLREGRPMYVTLSFVEWAQIEKSLGKYITSTEIHDLIIGLFSNKYKLVKR